MGGQQGPVKRAFDRVRGVGTVVVLAALGLIAIPTAFALFPEATQIDPWWRGLIMAGWVLAAAFITMASRARIRTVIRGRPPLTPLCERSICTSCSAHSPGSLSAISQ